MCAHTQIELCIGRVGCFSDAEKISLYATIAQAHICSLIMVSACDAVNKGVIICAASSIRFQMMRRKERWDMENPRSMNHCDL